MKLLYKQFFAIKNNVSDMNFLFFIDSEILRFIWALFIGH